MTTKQKLITTGFLLSLFILALVAFPGIQYTIYKHLPVNIRWGISYLLADKFLIGMIYFVEKDNALLLVKHRYQAQWGLPGGWLNHDESFEASVQREMQEELGVSVSDINVMEIRKVPGKQVIDMAVKCRIKDGELSISDSEVAGYHFFKKDTLPHDILHTHKPYIERYLLLNDQR